MSYEYELTILMPCLNEAETLETCIKKAQTFLRENNVNGEVLIADNGSTDGSREIAVKAGARVVPIAQRGYGAALIGGCEAARESMLSWVMRMTAMIFFTLCPSLKSFVKAMSLSWVTALRVVLPRALCRRFTDTSVILCCHL